MERTQRHIRVMVATVAMLLPWGCGRTIEEQEPRELVEHRLEPCRKWCTPMLSPDCGIDPENVWGRTVEGCVEDCADIRGGWEWALQEDGTDGCAEEWFAMADCMDALTCEGQRSYFRRRSEGNNIDYPCKEEIAVKRDCFYSTPTLERAES
jgi:hypothetical protein